MAVDIVAPGGTRTQPVLSTNIGGGFGFGSGTSQAAAHLTGLVALILEVKSNLTLAKVRAVLKDTALDLGFVQEAQGNGLVDAALAAIEASKY